MIADRITLDTNILIYAFDVRDPTRHETALKIMEKMTELDCVITLQALSEFYHATTRKNHLSPEVAAEQIEDWCTIFPIATAKPGTLLRAVTNAQKHGLSFWDAMLWSTARDAGVSVLLSEDFNHHQEIAGVKIINPFIDDTYLALGNIDVG